MNRSARLRLLAAGVLAAGLILAVILLAGGGSEGDDGVVAADPDCLRLWNEDPAALALGRHQANFHRYTSAQVVRLDVQGGTYAADPGGTCAVSWAAAQPPRELRAAAQVISGGEWIGLSSLDGVSEERLAELQEGAISAANVAVNEQGALVPF